MTSCLKRIIYTSSNAHIFVICKDNIFKFSVVVHNSQLFLFLYISHFGLLLPEGPFCQILAHLNTVNSEIFASILFSRRALKDIFAKLKIRDKGMIYLISKRRSDFTISRGFYFHETSHNLQYCSNLFVCVDALCLSQQPLSHVRAFSCLPMC